MIKNLNSMTNQYQKQYKILSILQCCNINKSNNKPYQKKFRNPAKSTQTTNKKIQNETINSMTSSLKITTTKTTTTTKLKGILKPPSMTSLASDFEENSPLQINSKPNFSSDTSFVSEKRVRFEIDIRRKSHKTVKQITHEIFERMIRFNLTHEDICLCFNLLLTYLGNIAKNPDEISYRRINGNKKSFENRVNIIGGPMILKECGFTKQTDKFWGLSPDFDVQRINEFMFEMRSIKAYI